MKKALGALARFRRDEDGATMIEYSLLIGLITVAVVTLVISVGGWVQTQWNELWTNVQNA